MSSSDADARDMHRKATCLLALLTFLFLPSCCLAQQDDPSQENATLTLHVYTNLIQIPVLILGPYLDYAPKIDPRKLTVSLDHGKPFHPVHVRPEGDDPISLAILLDLSNDENNVLPKLADSFAELATKSLHPHDEVAVYALDCNLTRIANFASPDPNRLRLAADSAIASIVRDKKHHRSCGNDLHLFDAFALTADELKQRSGRRVLLAITQGEDSGSQSSGEHVHQLLVDYGVALFGLSVAQGNSYGLSGGYRGSGRMGGMPSIFEQPSPQNLSFHAISEFSGGIVRSTLEYSFGRDLERLIKTLRERIIIEFPRPKEVAAGLHSIDVELAKSRAFIRPAGTGVPIADPNIMKDPTTIHPEDSPPPDVPLPVTSSHSS